MVRESFHQRLNVRLRPAGADGAGAGVDESVGVSISNGQISYIVNVTGDGANRIADNYVIPLPEWTFTFAPGTIVEGSFTEDGPWEKNDR
jgi:hypothetical protein